MRAIRHRQGETNIADALETTRRFVFDASAGDRADAANVAILVTDGVANREQAETDIEASLLKAQGTMMVLVIVYFICFTFFIISFIYLFFALDIALKLPIG